MEVNGDLFGVFALSSAICAHLVSKHDFDVDRRWYDNKWCWAGFFGSLPALVAMIAHIYFSKENKEKGTDK